MWEEVFGVGVVKVEVRLHEIDEVTMKEYWGDEGHLCRMIWSLKVL